MFEHMLMPLHRQFDGGFGATGEAFKEAADQLVAAETEGTLHFVNGHLPINFLYRHAIELFLKSMIVVIHRRLQIPEDDWFQDANPKVVVEGRWKELHQVHGVLVLYAFVRALVHAYADELGQIARTDWSSLPDDLGSWITSIDEADPSSTFFRYPTTKNPSADVDKSSFKDINPDDELKSIRAGAPPAKVYLIVKDDADEIVAAYGQDDEPLPELREALTKAAELLSGIHFGMRGTCEWPVKVAASTRLHYHVQLQVSLGCV